MKSRRQGRLRLSICIVLLVCLQLTSGSSDFVKDEENEKNKPGKDKTRQKQKQHNIIFILIDDQDLVLGGCSHMPKLDRYLRQEGIAITNHFVSTPICCPSRATYHTGKHIHNIPIRDNSLEGNCSGPHWNAGPEKQTIAVHMQKLGYHTGFVGKYLNAYGHPNSGGVEHVPPGWDRWVGLVGNSVYYNYTLSVDGKARYHADNYTAGDYLPEVVQNEAVEFLRKHYRTQQQQQQQQQQPFFLILSPPSCHGPHEPAPKYAYSLINATYAKHAPRTPNYGVSQPSDLDKDNKHWLVRNQGLVWKKESARRSAFTDWEHLRRLEAMLSIDDMIEEIINTLKDIGQLHDTYIFYTSDHGYHLGQFGLMKDKRYPYEFDIRVPSFVRGPGILPNTLTDTIVSNVDLAPTFIDIGHGIIPSYMDGKSILHDLLEQTQEQQQRRKLKESVRKQETEQNIQQQPTRTQQSIGRRLLIEYNGEGYNGAAKVCENQWSPGMACFVEGLEPLSPKPPPSMHIHDEGPICSCQDSANNTYSCIRTISTKENTIYCEFDDDDQFVEYYDLDDDFWQRKNQISYISTEQHNDYHTMLATLKTCKGADCIVLLYDDNDDNDDGTNTAKSTTTT